MQHDIIERELRIEASPEIVYEVISSAEHLRQWWPDDAELDPTPGGSGTITFGDPAVPDAKTETLTVVEADPPGRFAFRWLHDPGQTPSPDNSLLVTFDLVPSGNGTLLRFTETGFRGRGWEAAIAEQTRVDHVRGWDLFLPRLTTYAHRLATRS